MTSGSEGRQELTPKPTEGTDQSQGQTSEKHQLTLAQRLQASRFVQALTRLTNRGQHSEVLTRLADEGITQSSYTPEEAVPPTDVEPRYDRSTQLVVDIHDHASRDREEGLPIEDELDETAIQQAAAQLKELNTAVADLIVRKGEGITYDDFFETAIAHYPPALVSRVLAGYDRGEGEMYRRVDSLSVAHLRAFGEQYIPLLIDPGISMGLRRYDFLAFAEKTLTEEPGLDPLELRKRFIATFEVKTYYRGIVIRDDSPQRPPLSANVERAVSGKHQSNFPARVDFALEQTGLEQQANELARAGLPVTGAGFYDAGEHHIGSGATTMTSFLSVSEFPEIVYYATADNGERRWQDPKRGWDGHQSLAIDRFRMSSFYALDRRSIWLFPNRNKHTYNIGNLHDLPIDAAGVEALVPIALPITYGGDQRTFKPPFDTPESIPTAANWE